MNRKEDEVKDKDVARYEPEAGDLIAFTNIRPKSMDDLNKLIKYHIAYVQAPRDKRTKMIPIRSSKCMEDIKPFMRSKDNKEQRLYAVYLTNMTTNVRIWKALNSDMENANMNIIGKVLRAVQL